MGRYTDLIAEVKRRQSAGEGAAKLTKERRKSETLTPDDLALQTLWRLMAKHRANLIAGGYSPAGAWVRLIDWQAALELDVDTFAPIVRELVKLGRVEHLHEYARPTAQEPPG